MKRSTIVGYIQAAEFQTRKALMTAAQCKEISDKEYLEIRRALIKMIALREGIKK